MKPHNKFIIEDLTRLRDELKLKGFNPDNSVRDANIAEIVFKINSCLFSGYPRRLDDVVTLDKE